MHPILFQLGNFTIHSYGLLLALGSLLGLWVLGLSAKRYGLDPDKVVNLAIWTLLAGIVGSRAAFVLLELPSFAAEPWRVLFFWEGGMVFYGGLALALLVGVPLALRDRLPMLVLLDCFAPAVAIGQAVGRIGCFAAGCCYGKASDLWCSVTFTDPHTLAPPGVSLHPAQLYSSAELTAVFLFLVWFRRKRQVFSGQIFFLYGLIHGIGRLIVEQFRGDWRGQPLTTWLTPTGAFALGLAVFSLFMLIILWQRQHRQKEGQ